MELRPCERFTTITKENGGHKTIRTFSYVVLLCRIDGGDVMAVRYDGFTSRTDLHKILDTEYAGWKIKGIWRLYDEDFKG